MLDAITLGGIVDLAVVVAASGGSGGPGDGGSGGSGLVLIYDIHIHPKYLKKSYGTTSFA